MGCSVGWPSVWQPGRFDRQFGPSFETSQHSCPLLQSPPHCSDIWGKAVFNNKPFRGEAWCFCSLVFCVAPRNEQPGGTSDTGLVTQTGHGCLSSQCIGSINGGWEIAHLWFHLTVGGTATVGGNVNTQGWSVTGICPWGARSLPLEFCFEH